MTKPKHRQLFISRAELARRKGVTPGAVTRAAATFLRKACSGRRIDAAHPDVLIWLGEPARGAPKAAELMLDETAVPLELAMKQWAVPAGDAGRLAAALVPVGHVSASEFASLAGVALSMVVEAARGPLATAVMPSGRLDVDAPVARAFFAAHPFTRARSGEPLVPEGYLAPACVEGDAIDVEHPVARVFLLRCTGHLPNEVA